MSIEDDTYEQAELFGEYPIIPQWEIIADTIILEEELPETSEVSSYHQERWWTGDI